MGSPRPAARKRLLALFTLLYFSEGAPIGFLWWALPTLLRDEGVAVARVTGLMAMLVLPWTFKFLVAPVVDACRGPRWGLRHWIMSAQVGMGLCLLPLLGLHPVADFSTWSALLFLHAICAATQDVAVDALAVGAVDAADRGIVNGAMQAGMILGRSLFGGLAILAVARAGWPAVFLALLVAIWSSLLALRMWGKDVEEEFSTEAPASAMALGRNLARTFATPATWIAFAFALCGGAAFEAAGALAGPFLLDRAVSKETVGVFFAGPTVVAMLIGGLLGGKLSDRWGRLRSVSLFLVGVVACVVALAVAASGASHAVLFVVYGALYFFIGLFTAASYAMFMDLTDARVGATQFSAFMAATNGCEAWSVWASGRIVEGSGYPSAFLAMALVSGASLILLGVLARQPRRFSPN